MSRRHLKTAKVSLAMQSLRNRSIPCPSLKCSFLRPIPFSILPQGYNYKKIKNPKDSTVNILWTPTLRPAQDGLGTRASIEGI